MEGRRPACRKAFQPIMNKIVGCPTQALFWLEWVKSKQTDSSAATVLNIFRLEGTLWDRTRIHIKASNNPLRNLSPA
jgi:hypothetical protein